MEFLEILRKDSKKIGEQKSDSWLEWRKGRITSTDMHTLYSNSTNPEQIQKLFFKKLGFDKVKFCGNEYTEHGNFYENTAIKKYEDLLKNKVEHFNGILHKNCERIAFSPDGIVFNENETILIEVKCPFTRKIDNVISSQYKYQCQTGMEVLHSWGFKNVKTHFVQYKPKNFGKYSNNEILSINILERNVKIGKQMIEKVNDFFTWLDEYKNEDFDSFLPH